MRLVSLAAAYLPWSIKGQSFQTNVGDGSQSDGSQSSIEGRSQENIGRSCLWSDGLASTQDGKATGVRALKQAASSVEGANVTYVETAEALQDAVSRGKSHIEITKHLDLTSLKNFDGVTAPVKLHIKDSTNNLRVRIS
jgi:hypothetical protein